MRFFGRKDEIAELHNIRNLSLHTARFTIVAWQKHHRAKARKFAPGND